MRKWFPLVAVSLGTFMLLVDVTIVNVALPAMSLDLEATFSSLQWVIDGYALTLAALLLVAGAGADRFGRRRVYVIGLVVFALASLACGLAPSAAWLVAARLLQGIGAAAMFAATTALLAACYSGRDRGTAFGVWGAVNGASAAAGPLLGGVLTQNLDWRWIFWVNVPIAVVTVVVTLKHVPESKTSTAPIDVIGASAFTVAVAGLVYGLISGGEHGWSDPATIGGLALAAVALAVFVAVELRSTAPLLDLRLFTNLSFTVLMITAVIMQAAAFGHLAYVSIWQQSILELSPTGAGWAVLPLAAAAFVASAAFGRVLHGGSPRLPVGVGMILIGAGNLLLTLVTPESGWASLLPGLIVLGLGVGLGTPVLVTAALETVREEQAGMASGAVNTFRQLGTALGIAVLGTVFTARITNVVAADGTVPNAQRVADGFASGGAQQILAAAPEPARAVIDTLARKAFADGLDSMFTVSGISAVVVGLLVLGLVRGNRRHLSEPVAVGH